MANEITEPSSAWGDEAQRAAKKWHREKLGKQVAGSLEKNNIPAVYVLTREEALAKVLDKISLAASVGFGDSVTLEQVGVLEALRQRKQKEIFFPPVSPESVRVKLDFGYHGELETTMRKALLADVFLCGTNAVTKEGQLVNIDGAGNRVAAMLYGPKKVIIVVGINKIVDSVEAGIRRAKEVTAIQNFYRKRPRFNSLPCQKTGTCHDCQAPDKPCRLITIIDGVRLPWKGRINVVIVGEELGL